MADPCAQADRINSMEKEHNELELNTAVELAKVNSQLAHLDSIAETYVTKERFQTVQVIVYGFTGIILSSVLVALIAKVISK